jgi:hypothetical protein
MPIDQSKLDRMIRMDDYLSQREQDKLNGYDDEDEDTDPVEFQEAYSARQMPVAEPPDPLRTRHLLEYMVQALRETYSNKEKSCQTKHPNEMSASKPLCARKRRR